MCSSDLFNNIHHIYIENENNKWISTDAGLALIKKTFFKPEFEKIPETFIISINQAPENKFYLTDGNEIYSIEEKQDQLFTSILPVKSIKGIQQVIAYGKAIVVSTIDSRLLFYKKNKKYKSIDLSRFGGSLFYILKDKEDNLWICQDYNKGILRITPEFEIIQYDEQNGLNSRIIVIRQNKNGDIYAGGISTNSYFYKYDSISDSFINLSQAVNTDTTRDIVVHDLCFDIKNNIWLGTNAGLFKFDNETFSHIKFGNNNLEVKAIACDTNNALWMGTDKGLFKYYDNKWYTFTKKNGLSASMVNYSSN